jgi:hypothetical protein
MSDTDKDVALAYADSVTINMRPLGDADRRALARVFEAAIAAEREACARIADAAAKASENAEVPSDMTAETAMRRAAEGIAFAIRGQKPDDFKVREV